MYSKTPLTSFHLSRCVAITRIAPLDPNPATITRIALSFTFSLAQNRAEWMENGHTMKPFFTAKSASLDEDRRLA